MKTYFVRATILFVMGAETDEEAIERIKNGNWEIYSSLYDIEEVKSLLVKKDNGKNTTFERIWTND